MAASKSVWVIMDPKREYPQLFQSRRIWEDHLSIHRPEVQGRRQESASIWHYGSKTNPITARSTKIQGADDLGV
jgi:hypothetical protein